MTTDGKPGGEKPTDHEDLAQAIADTRDQLGEEEEILARDRKRVAEGEASTAELKRALAALEYELGYPLLAEQLVSSIRDSLLELGHNKGKLPITKLQEFEQQLRGFAEKVRAAVTVLVPSDEPDPALVPTVVNMTTHTEEYGADTLSQAETPAPEVPTHADELAERRRRMAGGAA